MGTGEIIITNELFVRMIVFDEPAVLHQHTSYEERYTFLSTNILPDHPLNVRTIQKTNHK